MPPLPLFWIVALLLVAATLAALVWPLLRIRPSAPTSDADADAEAADDPSTRVYRDHKRQLDDELAAGAITEAERDAAQDELAQRLGAELDAAPARAAIAETSPPRRRIVAAVVLVAIIPATAIVLYAMFGHPDAMRAAATDDGHAPMSQVQIETLVENLAAHMKADPADPTGWRLLGRAYASLGRFPEAAAAFAEAASRLPRDAGVLADEADALAMSQGPSLQGEPLRLIARALAIDPNEPKALSLSAAAAMERKDYPTAITTWRKLQARMPPGSDEAAQVSAMITQAKAEAEHGTQPASAAGAISGRVTLDPALRDRVGANDTLFIFARAVDGPRMPLAVLRTTVGTLPRAFTLDDSLSMSPSAKLSAAGDVIVEARISKSGNATPAPGDLRGASTPVKPGAHGVAIVIGDVVR